MTEFDGVLDFMITRVEVDDDQDDGGIPLAEWEAVLRGDHTLEPVPCVMGRNPVTGETLQVPLEGGARWVGHPDGSSLPMWWHHGKVVGYSVDAATVEKAQALAAALRANCNVNVD